MVNEKLGENQVANLEGQEMGNGRLNHDMIEKISLQLWNQISEENNGTDLKDWQMWR
ncbi:hypothetical protein [Pedobacter rhizosphaerae]|nr:hypothetical protein [Pedobacter rhizosphaerae]